MDNNFSIGNRIRELRNQKHLSQEQLALSAEITTAYLGQIERNEKNPTVAVVAKLCGALGIELRISSHKRKFHRMNWIH